MSWENAKIWAADFSIVDTAHNITYDNWRLPTVNFTPPMFGFEEHASLLGYNVDTSLSEMAHLFYDELGNKAYEDANGESPQPGWGLINTDPFVNLQGDGYWTDTVLNTNYTGPTPTPEDGVYYDTFAFDFGYGWQMAATTGEYRRDIYALAVSTGDVGIVVVSGMPVGPDVPAIPEADTWAMLLAGLGLVGFMAKRRKQVEA